MSYLNALPCGAELFASLQCGRSLPPLAPGALPRGPGHDPHGATNEGIEYHQGAVGQILWKRTNSGIPNEINAIRSSSGGDLKGAGLRLGEAANSSPPRLWEGDAVTLQGRAVLVATDIQNVPWRDRTRTVEPYRYDRTRSRGSP